MNLSKYKRQLLASRLKDWHLLDQETKTCAFRHNQQELEHLFSMGQEHNPQEYRLFENQFKKRLPQTKSDILRRSYALYRPYQNYGVPPASNGHVRGSHYIPRQHSLASLSALGSSEYPHNVEEESSSFSSGGLLRLPEKFFALAASLKLLHSASAVHHQHQRVFVYKVLAEDAQALRIAQEAKWSTSTPAISAQQPTIAGTPVYSARVMNGDTWLLCDVRIVKTATPTEWLGYLLIG
ncbi:hypothetical protein ILUMI_01915 [Ignelater luminosus]|uniref:Uncharacterized protein n=1 Tax=Ignelater luminosus TaxID=2038154 RepID=A0A8K0GGZ1_IGNLU|nr:hypothetical protein ILUMI_01915 [Ignelater luminosus]